MKYLNTKQKAFTLIDILLTAAIISLLSSIFLFQVSEAKRKADDAHMKTEAQQVSNAINLYKNDNNGRTPLSVNAEAGTVYSETDQEYQETMQLLVNGGYIPEIPDSPDGQSYTYATDSNNNAFFAFKLKQGTTSGNRKNSCSVNATLESTKTFTSCQLDMLGSCIEGSGVECFNNSDYSNLFSYCGCNGSTMFTSNSSIMPLQICQYFFYSCPFGMFSPLSLSPHMCTYTLSDTSGTPACDGSSTGDYCECI